MTAIERADADRLVELETVIDSGLRTFVEVGTALAEVRDSRLYRDHHETFEDYCRDRWNMSRFYAHRLIDAADVVTSLPIGNTAPPTNEAQARALAAVPTEKRAEVWRQAVEETGGKPTAAVVTAISKPKPVIGVDLETGEITDPVAEFVATDPSIQDAQYRARLARAVSQVRNDLLTFTADRVAEVSEDEHIEAIQWLTRDVANWADSVIAARRRACIRPVQEAK